MFSSEIAIYIQDIIENQYSYKKHEIKNLQEDELAI